MIDCLIVGGGHCGLLAAEMLHKAGLDYRVVDESARAGDIWRRRPKNLRLFTSRQFCGLGDFRMNGDPGGFPSATEFADHVERFASARGLRLTLQARVIRLSRADGGFVARLSNGDVIRARSVINATGSNQQPVVPAYAERLSPAVVQVTAQDYTDASHFPAGSRVAVVGDGASGRQIARELAASHRVLLARGRVRKLVPNRVLGQDIFWWLKGLGVLFADTDSTVARIMRRRDPIPAAADNDQRLAQAGVQLRVEAVEADGTGLLFSDGVREAVDAVVWCVGYAERTDWIDLPAIRPGLSYAGSRGRTPEPGLFVLGRKWLSCRASELVLGAQRDADMVVRQVLDHCRRHQAQPSAAPAEVVPHVQ